MPTDSPQAAPESRLRRAFFSGPALLAAFAFTLIVNLSRGDPIASLGAASLIALVLYRFRVRADRPRGIAQAVVEAER